MMTIRQLRRRLQQERKVAQNRFKKHKRKNLLAQPGIHNFIIILDSLKPTFNIGKIFRSADAFGARAIHIVGTHFFNPASAMGSFKWVPAKFHENFDECYRKIKASGYTIFCLSPENGQSLIHTALPEYSAFVFGNEELGFSFEPKDYDGIMSLGIEQYGKVQSLNVSVAASITMYEYVRQHHS